MVAAAARARRPVQRADRPGQRARRARQHHRGRGALRGRRTARAERQRGRRATPSITCPTATATTRADHAVSPPSVGRRAAAQPMLGSRARAAAAHRRGALPDRSRSWPSGSELRRPEARPRHPARLDRRRSPSPPASLLLLQRNHPGLAGRVGHEPGAASASLPARRCPGCSSSSGRRWWTGSAAGASGSASASACSR